MQDKPTNTKRLILSATHGDEGFSIPVVKELKQKYQFDWSISNPKALEKNTRYIDFDLNRSGPGDSNAKEYEKRRAYEIIQKANKYDEIIDLHGTNTNCGLFIILSDPSWENIELAKKLDIENVVLWPSLKPTGPLTQFIRSSLEIECGPKNNPKTAKKLNKILEKYFQNKRRKKNQNYYIVTGKIKGENNPNLTDFVKTKAYKDPFYPLLAKNNYKGITCYKTQKLFDTL